MTTRQQLWDIALDQYGYVTTKNARDLEIHHGELARLARRGKLVRVAHGVYRFGEFPTTGRDEYMLAVLWTGNPDAALSHETALAVHDLCDVNPNVIHLSVPQDARIKRQGGEGYVIHPEALRGDQIGWWEGIRTVTEKTAIEQGIATGVPVHLLEQAIRAARARGRISEAENHALRTYLEVKYAY